MAYILGRPFATISVLSDEDSYGREMDTRTRRWIEEHVMVTLAGAETDEHWMRRQDDVPDDWRHLVDVGAQHDMSSAVDLASYVCGSPEETGAYLEWLRQRVRNYVGRLDAELPDGEHSGVVRRVKFGDPRFWSLVDALAEEVQTAGHLSWRKAREVLRDAEHRLLTEQTGSRSVFRR